MADTNDKHALERLLDEIVDCAVSMGKSDAMKGFGAFTEIDSISMSAMRKSISQKRAQILGHFDETAAPPAGSALADSIDSLGFVISGDNPPVKEWVSECGGGCMPATKEEKMMWDMLHAALRARAVPDAVALNDARWRALIGCKRIRLIGCSGVHPDGTLMADRDGHVHFGAEFWTHHDSESSQVSINVITAFADAMLAASKEDGK